MDKKYYPIMIGAGLIPVVCLILAVLLFAATVILPVVIGSGNQILDLFAPIAFLLVLATVLTSPLFLVGVVGIYYKYLKK